MGGMTQVFFLCSNSQDLNTINIPTFRFPYQSVEAVLNDDILDRAQKRAILSSWASDLFAIEGCPWLRRVPGVARDLKTSEIFAGLRTLDEDPPPRGGAHGTISKPIMIGPEVISHYSRQRARLNATARRISKTRHGGPAGRNLTPGQNGGSAHSGRNGERIC